MKRFLALAALAALACHSVPAVNEPSTLKFRVIHSGSQARYQGSVRNLTYVPMEDAYQRTWASMVGSEPAPPVDFTKEGVLFIIAGQRPTGGYAIDVRGVTVKGDTLVVDAPVTAPSPDMMVTQAFTSPFAVVAVDKVDAARVMWSDAADLLDKPKDQ
jgi:hypothetical protein